ncbi:MAG: TIGR00730 family Rossman fold protein [Hyphomonadaceae bacterium]|nr:TIGR00730 family Rossman fold protein [Hyphomonadaceae bacterium]
MADSTSTIFPTPSRQRRTVCVYCGSSETTRPEYHALATRLGEEMAQRGVRLVYGGGSIGLMGRCARAAHAAGGDVLGVMPRFLEKKEIVLKDVPHRMVDTMHERKRIMFEESDGFIVLPGGIGTLEEAVETLSWRRLELHAKPLVFLCEDDFWDPFFHLIEHTIEANLTPRTFVDAVLKANNVDDALDAIEARIPA